MKKMKTIELQNNERPGTSVFDIPYYRMLKKYLVILGQYPTQTEMMNKICLCVLVGSCVSFILPTYFQMYVSAREKNWNEVVECLPQLVTATTSIIKVMNLQLNRKYLKKIYISVKEDWKEVKLNGEVHILDEITNIGSKIALLYRSALLLFLIGFVLLPMLNPTLDIIMPLNETRPRVRVFTVYYFVSNDQYFYSMYWHATCYSIASVLIIVGVDSLYMVIAHHAAGLFAICGYKFQKLTKRKWTKSGITAGDSGYQIVKRCVEAHNKAFEFAEFLDSMNRQNFLLQVGFNMIGISVTAFQTAIHLTELDQVMRYGMFCIAQNFHLFYISLPGQIIADRSSEVANNLNSSYWYDTPVKIQKVLLTTHMRCSKPYELTAGGLYKMNIANFGMTFKTCMSYFTMLLSMQV